MRSPFRPLTEVAQELVAATVQAGDTVVDATAGNGHDTLFLARQVGPEGQVFAFDVQQTALESTDQRLRSFGLSHVTLLHKDHSQFATALPAALRGKLAAAMFNLGYLPGGEKSITTQPNTTLIALQAAMTWLRPGGLVTLLIYSGHATGQSELALLLPFLGEPPPEFLITEIDPQPERPYPPRLFVIQRRPLEESAP